MGKGVVGIEEKDHGGGHLKRRWGQMLSHGFERVLVVSANAGLEK